MIKLVFVGVYIPDWIAEDIDEETTGPAVGFSVVQVKPRNSQILTSHWESLVAPGWEFTIEFKMGSKVLPEVRQLKLEKERAGQGSNEDSDSGEDEDTNNKEPIPAKEMSKIIYVAKYLTPDGDGDYRKRITERNEDGIQLTTTPQVQSYEYVLEEHREMYFSDKHAVNVRVEMVDTIGSPVLYVRSPILLDALRAIIDVQSIPDEFTPREYSERTFSSDLSQGRFVLPFTDLYHYREKLLQYREIVGETHDKVYSTTCGEHIDILNEYLEGLTEVGLKEAERLASGPAPKTTFTSIWLLLKPGSDVYVREEGKLNAYVIESFSGGHRWNLSMARSTPYLVNVWNLNYDGQYLTRSAKTIVIPIFEHDREISSLPLFPVRFHVDEDPQHGLHQELVERGKRFVEMVRKPSFKEYTGPSKLQGIRTVSQTTCKKKGLPVPNLTIPQFNQTRVVVDHTSQPWNLEEIRGEPYADDPIQEIYDVELGEQTRIARCPCQSCEAKHAGLNRVERRPFDDYDDIDLTSKKTLTDHQYLLCWSHVFGFVLKDRAWGEWHPSRKI